MGFDIVIITNGPGELSAWVKPIVEQLSKTLPNLRIIIALVPCPYASGNEYEIASKLEGVTKVLDTKETLSFLFSNKLPNDFKFKNKGVVIHLGGDQFFTVLMGWKTKFDTTVYTEKHILWSAIIDKYFLSDQNIYANARLKGIPASKLSIVGNLMVDSVKPKMNSMETRERIGISHTNLVVSFLPGSKPFKVNYATPFMLKVADYLAMKNPDIQFIMSQSPYTPLYQLVGSVTNKKYISALGGISAKFGKTKNGNVLVTEQGTMISIIPPEFQYEAYQISDLCITLPGTNTAELAILGIPMLVIAPLNAIQHIPFDGILGRIADIPLIKKLLKTIMAKIILKKIKYLALPNQKQGKFLVPEMVGNILPIEVAVNAYELLQDAYKRRELAIQLKGLMGKEGTARNIVDKIKEMIIKKYNNINVVELSEELEENEEDWSKRNLDNEI